MWWVEQYDEMHQVERYKGGAIEEVYLGGLSQKT